MTKIKRITLHGFKSFANKTDVLLDDKFNCILGPNGSGKSNLGDALCFVLGRISAKSMRAEKAANLIFNGGKSKKPSSKAYVEIVFDNTSKIFPVEDKEIVVNRTISSKGSSTYRVNGQKHTRSEVVEMLGSARINPQGYNIILQGDITRFVDMSPLERRRIIEEISDVSIYEEKKHKAMLELGKVDEKLSNAAIILKERSTYLKELKKDRDQALEFKNVKDSIDAHKATYLHLQIEERQAEKAKLDEKVGVHEAKRSQAEAKIEEHRSAIGVHKEKIGAINKEIEEKGEKEQVRVHREIEDLKVNLAKDRSRISSLKDEIVKIEQRRDQFSLELKELEQKTKDQSAKAQSVTKDIGSKQKELERLEADIAKFKKKHKLGSSADMDQELESLDKQIEVKQEEVQKVRATQQELLREQDKIEFQLQTLDERLAKVKEVAKEHKDQIKQLSDLKKTFKQATLELNKCLDQDSSFASQLARARSKLQEARERETKLRAQVAQAQASLEANRAVKAILENKRKFKGVHGTVGQLGQVSSEYSQALEAAAAGRMQHIVVESDEVAAECIKYLKSAKLGSASFIPLNKIRYRDVDASDMKLLKKQGTVDFAINLVSYERKFKKAFSYVFGNTLIVEDIDAARRVGIGGIKMTTLDGNSVEGSGVMRGGFTNRRRGSGFSEKGVTDRLTRIENEVAELEGVLSNVVEKRRANEEQISALRNRKGELEAEVIKLEKSLHLETGDLEANQSLRKELETKLKDVTKESMDVQRTVSKINKDLAGLKSKKHMLRSELTQLRNPRLLAQLQAYEESRQQLRENIVRLESEAKNSGAQVQQLLEPERLKILEILKQHEKEMVAFQKEIATLEKSTSSDEKNLAVKEKASKAFYAAYKGLFADREKLSDAVSKAESAIEQLREKARGAEREINLFSLKNAEIKAKLAGLEEEFAQYKDVELLKDKQVGELQKELSKMELVLSQMSAVNMKALEIYEEVEKEYNALVEKKEALGKEKTDVLTLMNEIETKKKEHFMKTFDEANKHFQEIFTRLFRKGKASLVLENPTDPFEGGMDIKVKITGKRYMDLKSLSGGEKTLTALSFIFAIQEYQPASFYILDEIDAALDKHNSERLAQLIRAYADKAQYVLVSHKDSLISEADTLFGVSMSDGVSKITSLRI